MKLKRTQEEPQIPTSSMADIAFLLIVFFMVTTVFSANKGMEHVLPPESEAAAPEDAVFIKINPGGDCHVDGEWYGKDQVSGVYDRVNQVLQVNPRKPVIVLTNPEAVYGDLVGVLDQLKRLEAAMGPNYSMSITLPSKDERAVYAGR